MSQMESYTYLIKNQGGMDFWTTTPSQKVHKDTTVPASGDNDVKVYCAMNEIEPFIVVVNPGSGTGVTVTLPDFGESKIAMEMFEVQDINLPTPTDSLGCTGACDYPDVLWPIENGDSVTIVAGENTAFWVNVKIPPSGMTAGDYSGDMTIGGVSITINLHVFNFAIPEEIHVKSQMNFGFEVVLNRFGVPIVGAGYWPYVDRIKRWWMDHRMTPKSTTWPGGLTSSGGSCFITYDCDANEIIDEEGIWGFDLLADQVFKNGINGTKYPSGMFMTFQDNDSGNDQRPGSICDEDRQASDWKDNEGSSFNSKWFRYYRALQDYLDERDLLDTVYHYGWNEPQNEEDYEGVAWYSRELKNAAPGIRLMVSEEARPGIYANEKFPGGKIDIWLPVLDNYEPSEAYSRKDYCDEETWVYFLHGTTPPYLNPITIDHPGNEPLLLGWLLWKYRIEGIAYYSMNNWGSNPYTNPEDFGQNGNTFIMYPPDKSNNNIVYGSNNHRFVPSIRFELMRDGLEMYEYLYLLNGGPPEVNNQGTLADVLSQKIIMGVKNYLRDDEFIYNLRRIIGERIAGESGSINPDSIIPDPPHARGVGAPSDYYINFQDPSGNPSGPLIVDGDTYEKIGWTPYSESLGYGFFGEFDHVEYYWNSGGSGTEVERSSIFDDWGREKTFQYVVPNGCYDVEVCIGGPNRNDDHNYVVINTIPFVNDEPNNGEYIIRTNEVCVIDYMISMEFMLFDEYTFMNYLKIEQNGNTNPPPAFEEISYSRPPSSDLYCTSTMNQTAAIVVGVIVGILFAGIGLLCLLLLIAASIAVTLLGLVNYSALFAKISNKDGSDFVEMEKDSKDTKGKKEMRKKKEKEKKEKEKQKKKQQKEKEKEKKKKEKEKEKKKQKKDKNRK